MYSQEREVVQRLFQGGPTDLKTLREETNRRREEIAQAYYEKEYARVLKEQQAEWALEEMAKAKKESK